MQGGKQTIRPSRTPLRRKTATLLNAYQAMINAFGPQHWWPAETREEVIIGAVLTQNTAWKNVEKALDQLKAAGCCDLRGVATAGEAELAQWIRPAGYYNIKARRLQSVARFFMNGQGADLERFQNQKTDVLREDLLRVHGVGRETADSILLYALDRTVFVIDAYTLRIGARHGWYPTGTDYESARHFFERSLPVSRPLFNEYHALLVRVGNRFCKPRPHCDACPLRARGCGPIHLE